MRPNRSQRYSPPTRHSGLPVRFPELTNNKWVALVSKFFPLAPIAFAPITKINISKFRFDMENLIWCLISFHNGIKIGKVS